MTTFQEIQAKTAMLAMAQNDPHALHPAVYHVLPWYLKHGAGASGASVAAPPGDLAGALGMDPDARSTRLAEEELERQRTEAQQRAEKERESRIASLADKLRRALRSKSLTEAQRGAVAEALAAVEGGDLEAAQAMLEAAES